MVLWFHFVGLVEEEGEIQPKEETITLEEETAIHAATTIQAAFRGMKVNVAFWVISHAFLPSADFFFKINFLKKFFQEYHQNVKQFGPKSGPMIHRA